MNVLLMGLMKRLSNVHMLRQLSSKVAIVGIIVLLGAAACGSDEGPRDDQTQGEGGSGGSDGLGGSGGEDGTDGEGGTGGGDANDGEGGTGGEDGNDGAGGTGGEGGEGGTQQPEPIRVEISPEAPQVQERKTVQLTATAYGNDDQVLSGLPVSWSTSDPNTATIDAGGLVTGVGPGTARITATIEGEEAQVDLTVHEAAVFAVTILDGPSALLVGNSVQLTAEVTDDVGFLLEGRVISWSSSNPAVADVDSDGNLTAMAKGEAVITAEAEGVEGQISVTVEGLRVEISPSSPQVREHKTVQLTAAAYDIDDQEVPGLPVFWSSSDLTTARVDANGLVTGVKPGSARISATIEGEVGQVDLIVEEAAVFAVTILDGPFDLPVGSLIVLAAEAVDDEGIVLEGRTVTWSSSAPAVAEVAADGTLTAIAAGEATITAEVDGVQGQTAVTVEALPPPQISMGAGHACFLEMPGVAWCWGKNDKGQLGTGATGAHQYSPVRVMATQNFEVIGTGHNHSCGITDTGAAFCWGTNDREQLSLPKASGTSSTSFVAVPGGPYDAIHGGNYLTCALDAAGKAWCWGLDSVAHYLGNAENTAQTPNPIAVSPPAGATNALSFQRIAQNTTTTCGLTTAQELYCWGENGSGQLGVGTKDRYPVPQRVLPTQTVTDFAMLALGGCALTTGGDTYCWGGNNAPIMPGPLWVQNTTPVLVPADGKKFTTLSAGSNHVCGLDAAGEAWCWGDNWKGQIGAPTSTADSLTPVKVPGGHHFIAITSRENANCAITDSYEVYCWGDNATGQLGNGNSEVASSHQPIKLTF